MPLYYVFIIFQIESNTPFRSIEIEDSKVNRMTWGTVEDYIITGHENGQICQYDWKTGTWYLVSELYVIISQISMSFNFMFQFPVSDILLLFNTL